MPIYRDDQGNIVEVKSEKWQPEKLKREAADDLEKPTDDLGTDSIEDEPPTTDVGGGSAGKAGASEKQQSKTDAIEGKTDYLFGRKTGAGDKGDASDAATSKEAGDIVVGWLVVVEGPGKGADLRIGPGKNSIGRGAENRIQLDFGDTFVSRKEHTAVIFDPLNTNFFLAPSSSSNLTYQGDVPVLAPIALASGDEFRIGETVLRFVALCGPEFSWHDRG